MDRPDPKFAAAMSLPARVHRFDPPATHDSARAIAVETPVNILYGTVPYAVMMATPADLEDFAIGFTLTEGIVAARDDIRAVRAEPGAHGIRLHVDLAPAPFHRVLARRRAMNGRTSCGVCGITDLEHLPRTARRATPPGPPVTAEAIRRAIMALPADQALNALTRSVHAAAWATPDGTIACLREDVGRHNALDKLIGALLQQRVDPARGFALVTSRCSYEMVEKTAAFGAQTLVAMSAPTSLGVERAAHHRLTLVGIARADALTVYAGAVA